MSRLMQWLDAIPEGPRLPSDAPEAEVRAVATGADSLVIEFGAFRDGRGFSLASILREGGYGGRLIAAGRVLPDQARHLRRTGFDAVVIRHEDRGAWERMDAAFSGAYQSAATERATILDRRAPTAPDLKALANDLNQRAFGTDAEQVLRLALDTPGLTIAALSSFGADAAVLLHLVSRQRPDLPVLFLDTGQHFLQTLSYRQALSQQLGLSDVRIQTPDAGELSEADPTSDLWKHDTDACCDLRKVQPLDRAVRGFKALITGRRRHQNADRAALQPFEVLDGVLRINPLAAWTQDDIDAWYEAHALIRHPLTEAGYASIGCWPCTRATAPGEDARAGRWSGAEKTECGIHLGRRVQVEA